MNRGVNDGYKFNIQKDLLPLYGDGGSAGTFMKVIAEAAGVDVRDIMGHDLFLYRGCAAAFGEKIIVIFHLPG